MTDRSKSTLKRIAVQSAARVAEGKTEQEVRFMHVGILLERILRQEASIAIEMAEDGSVTILNRTGKRVETTGVTLHSALCQRDSYLKAYFEQLKKGGK